MHDRNTETEARKIVDKRIPQLELLTDSDTAPAAFEQYFSREYPGRGLRVKGFHFGHVYHKPGKSCRLNFNVSGEDGDHRPFEQTFYGRISANGKDRSSDTDHFPESWPGCGPWKPVSRWSEMNMLLYAFPYDVDMPYLGQLLSPGFVERQVEAHLERFGLSADWTVDKVVSHRAKYRNGKRCTLRFDATLKDLANQSRTIEFYSKTYDSPLSRYVYDALAKMFASPACTSGRLNIPAPLAHLDEANTLWQLAWNGRTFSKVGEELGWANLHNSGYMPRIADMLAALHQIEIPDLFPGPTPARVLDNACGDANDIAQFLPEREAELEEITSTLRALAPDVELQTIPTTIHGAFKIAQILCNGDQLALVDFDAVACGDPFYDVAEFLTSIIYLQISDNVPAEPLSKSVDMFLDQYRQQVPWSCDRSRLAWYMVSFLLGKIHSSLKRARALEEVGVAQIFDLVHAWLEEAKVECGTP